MESKSCFNISKDHKSYSWFRKKLMSDIYKDTKQLYCGYIYQLLLSYYNIDQKCSFPSYDLIKENYGIGKDTMIKYVNLLSEYGYITYEKGYKGRANRYCFPLEDKINNFNPQKEETYKQKENPFNN